MKKHLIIDATGERGLNSAALVEEWLVTLARQIGMQPLSEPVVHTLSNDDPTGPGVTGFLPIVTSHIAIHTFPEDNRFNADIFSCQDFDASEAQEITKAMFGAHDDFDFMLIARD